MSKARRLADDLKWLYGDDNGESMALKLTLLIRQEALIERQRELLEQALFALETVCSQNWEMPKGVIDETIKTLHAHLEAK